MKVAFIYLRDEFADVVSSQYTLLGHRLPASLLEGAMVIPMIRIGNAARVRPRNNREMNLHHCQTPTSAEGNVAKNFERYACSVNCASILKQNMRGSLRIDSVGGSKADVFIISNGGSAEATERIVRRLRGRFSELRFLVPSNAYSAATLMCLAGDEILMLPEGTLGPIDPQLNGVPARAIIRGFERLEERLAKEGPKALTAYVPLLQKYDLHLLERCRSANELSKELARAWLTQYAMRQADPGAIDKEVEFFCNWDFTQKSWKKY